MKRNRAYRKALAYRSCVCTFKRKRTDRILKEMQDTLTRLIIGSNGSNRMLFIDELL